MVLLQTLDMPAGFFRYHGENADDPSSHLEEAKTKEKIWIDALVENIPNMAFSGSNNVKEVIFDEGTKIRKIATRAFEGTCISSIVIPDSVTSIGDEAFRECEGLTTIHIPSSVTSIGNWAFSQCKGLTTISIPSSVTSIGDGAFGGCKGLTTIDIPFSVTSLEHFVFFECEGLTTISIPSSLTSIGKLLFGKCKGLTSIDIPSSVTTIGTGAFDGCEGLTNIYIPSSVTSIGKWAFRHCHRLTRSSFKRPPLSLWRNVAGKNCLEGCSFTAPLVVTDNMLQEESPVSIPNDVTHIIIDAGVTELSTYSLSGSRGVKHIDLPVGLERIEPGVFRKFPRLRYLQLPNSVPEVDFTGMTQFECLIVRPESLFLKGKNLFWDLSNFAHEKTKMPLLISQAIAESLYHKEILCDEYYDVELIDDDGDDPSINRYFKIIFGLCEVQKLAYEGFPGYDMARTADQKKLEEVLNGTPVALQPDVELGGMTVLHIYLKCGHSDTEVIRRIISSYPEAIACQDVSLNYPIHYFCQNQNVISIENDESVLRMLRMLVQKSKGTVLGPDNDGVTPFFHAFGNLPWSSLLYLYSIEPVTPSGEHLSIIQLLEDDYLENILGRPSFDKFPPDEQNGWVRFVSSIVRSNSNEEKKILDLIRDPATAQATVKVLASAKNADNRTALEVAVPSIRTALEERLLFLKRYEVTSAHVLHKSATCIVVEARDAKMSEYYKCVFAKLCTNGTMDKAEFGSFLNKYRFVTEDKDKDGKGEVDRYFRKIDLDRSEIISEGEFLAFCAEYLGNKVVLKFMRNVNQFETEISSRDAIKSQGSSEYVMDILRCHAPTPDQLEEDDASIIETINTTQPDVNENHLKEHAEKFFSTPGTALENKKRDSDDNGIVREGKRITGNVGAASLQYKYVLVMTKGDRNLDSIFRSERPGRNAIRELMGQIAKALVHLHDKGLIHGDLKMLNVVRESHTNILKLIDLDAAAKKSKSEDGRFVTPKFSSGVLPPEAVYFLQKNSVSNGAMQKIKMALADFERNEKKAAIWDSRGENAFIMKHAFDSKEIRELIGEERLPASVKLDVWAFGGILYCMCTGESLFEVNRDDDIGSFAVMADLYGWGAFKCSEKLAKVEDREARELLRCILQRDPARRISMQEILDDVFFDSSKNPDMTEVHQSLTRIEEKIDVVIEKIDKINQNLAKANSKLNQILKLQDYGTPRLVFVVPVTREEKSWWKSLELTKKIKICFVCPITYEIRKDDNGDLMGYETDVAKDWVQKWGPRIVMSIKVCQFAISVGRMAGLPLPSLNGVQEKITTTIESAVSENLDISNELLTNILSDDSMKELVGGDGFFSTSLDVLTGETSFDDLISEKVSSAQEKLKEASKLTEGKRKLQLINESSERVKKIAGDDETFADSGLVKAIHSDGTDTITEFVHPDIEQLFVEYGNKCFEMSQQEILKKVAESKSGRKAKKEAESKLLEAQSKLDEAKEAESNMATQIKLKVEEAESKKEKQMALKLEEAESKKEKQMALKLKEAESRMKNDYEKRLMELEGRYADLHPESKKSSSCEPCSIM